MRQVLWNLVRNAVQATAAGKTVKVKVAVGGTNGAAPAEPEKASESGAGPGELVLSVDDEGPGLSEEARARIFDAFYTTRAHGVGIGLAVVKRIVDDHAAMGARIAVQSPLDAEGKGGASFRITLRTDVARLPAGRWSMPSGQPL